MTQYEMTEKLAEKVNVSMEEARTALEASGWNILTATHRLEQENFRRMRELDEVASDCAAMAAQEAEDEQPSMEDVTADGAPADAGEAGTAKRCRGRGFKHIGRHIRRLVAFGNRNRFVVRRDGAELLEMPVTALVLLMLFAFWVCVPLMVIGLFAGCRFGFNGRELGREDINSALARVADAASHMKESAAKT